MASSTRAAAVLVAVVLASVGAVLHEHDTDAQAADHPYCGACHVRHLPGVETDGAPAPAAPDPAVRPVVSAPPAVERAAARGVVPTRGPPA